MPAALVSSLVVKATPTSVRAESGLYDCESVRMANWQTLNCIISITIKLVQKDCGQCLALRALTTVVPGAAVVVVVVVVTEGGASFI